MGQGHSLLCSAETQTIYILALIFNQPSICLWVVPAVNCSGHIQLNASLQNLPRKTKWMYRHCMGICHFRHIWCMYTLMCRNADVITQECSNPWSWTAQKRLGIKVCFLVTWPASTSSQEYIYPSLLFHVYVATHKTTRNVGQTQTEMVQTTARTHTRQEGRQD